MIKIPQIWFFVSGTVYVLGVFACLILATRNFTVGFGAGGALVLINAWASARKIRGSEFVYKNRATASIVTGFYLRLILMGICLFFLISFLEVDPLGLVTGLSVIPAGLFGMIILVYLANRSPQEV
jgi:hypothetical protein